MSESVNGHANGPRLESDPISSPRAFDSGELKKMSSQQQYLHGVLTLYVAGEV